MFIYENTFYLGRANISIQRNREHECPSMILLISNHRDKEQVKTTQDMFPMKTGKVEGVWINRHVFGREIFLNLDYNFFVRILFFLVHPGTGIINDTIKCPLKFTILRTQHICAYFLRRLGFLRRSYGPYTGMNHIINQTIGW